MSITDELRKVAAKTECANGRCEKLYRGDLDHIADRIDELVGREYIELPVDADGVTIHIGDEVEYGHNVGAVDKLLLNESDEPRVGTTFGGYFYGKELHHAKPDSWERIIRDAQGDGILNQIDGRPSDFEALVERCKRLAGEDA